MTNPDYILRDQAETLLRELGVRDPSRMSAPATDPTATAAVSRNERTYDRAVTLIAAGIKAELATRAAA